MKPAAVDICSPQGIFSNRGLEPSLRWMAITYIKNGVDRYWRVGAPKSVLFPCFPSQIVRMILPLCYCSPISDDEKAIVRNSLLQCLEEPIQQVSFPYH